MNERRTSYCNSEGPIQVPAHSGATAAAVPATPPPTTTHARGVDVVAAFWLSPAMAASAPAFPRVRPNLLGMTPAELTAVVERLGGTKDHAQRIFSRYFAAGVALRDVRAIPAALREKLHHAIDTQLPRILQRQVSTDGTRKYLLAAGDGATFETVYLPNVTRSARTNTLCISSQTGCAVGCTFCFTATLKRHRNLTAAEIVGQVVAVARDVSTLGARARPTNVVYMGMGEPLLNYAHVVQAARVLLHRDGLDFSKRRITVSTAGIVPRITNLGRDIGTLLAVSLNATTDTLRDRLMPINRTWPLQALLQAMRDYPKPRGGRVTVEYVLLRDTNDGDADAHRLAALLRDIPVKINLLPLNAHAQTPFFPPSPLRVAAFQQILWQHGYSAIVRTQRGDEINAACGQLGMFASAAPATREHGLMQ